MPHNGPYDDHPLLRARLEWEAENPRPESLVRVERAIVRALVAEGFGRQHQVTREDRFEIAVDDLFIRVEHHPEFNETAAPGSKTDPDPA